MLVYVDFALIERRFIWQSRAFSILVRSKFFLTKANGLPDERVTAQTEAQCCDSHCLAIESALPASVREMLCYFAAPAVPSLPVFTCEMRNATVSEGSAPWLSQ